MIAKAMALVLAGVLLAGCGKGGDDAGSPSGQVRHGMFAGTMDGSEYSVEVTCSYFDTDNFMFRSDSTDVSDSNGDGLIISGDEYNGKFSLTIVEEGRSYSIGALENFSKGGREARGSGKLIEDGTGEYRDILFSVACE